MGKSKEESYTETFSEEKTFNKGKGQKRKPRKGGGRRTNPVEKFASGGDFRSRVNDPNWYFKDKNTLDAVASFSFSSPLGSDLLPTEVYDVINKAQLSGMTAAVPGLMAMGIGLVPGIADNAQDPVNLAAQNVYSFVRYKNSGAKNYDAPDLMLYLLTMDSIYACWNWLKRIYGYTSTYSQLNRYMPSVYAKADYVDLDDIYAHLADFRAYINMTADRISAFCVPATMTYNVRHSWLFSNIFTDTDVRKPQQYMYTPAWFYQYDEVGSSKGGQLIPLEVNYDRTKRTKKKFADLRTIMDTLINSAMYSEDIGVMSGDILKAYESGNLFKLSPITADYKVEPVYSKAALSQIENANIWFTKFAPGAGIGNQKWNMPSTMFAVTQDPNTNYLKFRPTFTDTSGLGMDQVPIGSYLNFHWDNVTSEDVIDATRLMWSGEVSGDGQTFTMTSCGSEVVTDCNIYAFTQGKDANVAYVRNNPLTITEIPMYTTTDATYADIENWYDFVPFWLTNSEDIQYALKCVLITHWHWVAFDWAPLITCRITQSVDSVNTPWATPWMREWANYTILGNPNIKSLNDLAILSEFNVPN